MTRALWTTDRAALWRARASGEFSPEFWWYAGGALVLVTFFTSPAFWDILPCDHPVSDCGPIPVFSAVLPLVIVTAGLILVLPWLAVLTSAAAAGLAVAFWWPHIPVVGLWPVFPVALAWSLRRLHAGSARQRRIAAGALVPLPGQVAAAARSTQRPTPWERLDTGVAVAGVLALLGAVPLYAVYAHQVDADEASARRSTVVVARVLEVHDVEEDAYRIAVQLPETPFGPAERLVLTPYPQGHQVGQDIEVLVDPVDPDRTRLLEDVPDRTLPLAFGHLAGLVGLSALAWLVDERLRLRRLRRMPTTDVGIPIRVRRLSGSLRLMALDSEWDFARIDLHRDDPIRGTDAVVRPAYLLGGLAAHDPAVVVFPTGEASWPAFLEVSSSTWQTHAAAAVRTGVSGPEPQPSQDSSDLVWRRWSPWLGRALGAGALGLPFVTYPWVAVPWARLLLALGALTLAILAIRVEAPLVLLDSRRLSHRTMWTVSRIPVWSIARVELTLDLQVRLIDNQGTQIGLDLGSANRPVAERIAGFLARRPRAVDTTVAGTGFAETTQRWHRPTPVLIVAVLAVVIVAWALF